MDIVKKTELTLCMASICCPCAATISPVEGGREKGGGEREREREREEGRGEVGGDEEGGKELRSRRLRQEER